MQNKKISRWMPLPLAYFPYIAIDKSRLFKDTRNIPTAKNYVSIMADFHFVLFLSKVCIAQNKAF